MTTKRDFALLRQQAEARLMVTAQQQNDHVTSHSDMQRIIHELAVYQIELEMQQDELLQTRSELEESLDCYTELYDFAPLGYLTIDRDGLIRKANHAASRLLGVNRSRLKGDRLARFIAEESLGAYNAMFQSVFRTREHGSFEALLQSDRASLSSPDSFVSGTVEVIQRHTVRIDTVVSNDGLLCQVVLSDISMQKQVERENKELLARSIQARRVEAIGPSDGAILRNFNHQLLDKIIHSRMRLAALSYLYTVEQASFVEIKRQVKTTDGNLSVHLRMLESAQYIKCDKEISDRRPQTIYRVTQKGHEAWVDYKECLRRFLAT